MTGTAPIPTGRPGVLLAVLSLAGAAYALLQSLVVPALPVLQQDLHTSTTGVAWVFTSYLLAASVVTPIAGRLGDMHGKKPVLVVTLVGLALGTFLAATTHSLAVMIVARTIQGLGGAIFPLAFGIIRDAFPAEMVAGGIALISALLGIGGGLGIVLAGPIIDNLGYHWLFWIPLVLVLLSAVLAVVAIPPSTQRAPGRIHWLGLALLTGWLVALLIAVSEAPTWGWGSPKTLGLVGLALVLIVLWVRAEARSPFPLTDMRMMRRRSVATTNAAAFLLGFGMYSAFTVVPEFVQTPASTGYGFGASVTEGGLFLLPLTITMMIFSPIGGRLSNTVGSRVPLVAGAAVTCVAFVLLTFRHDEHIEVYVAMGLLGIGIGFAFASMANLIVEAVPREQTGVATGMNANVRTIGGAIGSQIVASIIAAGIVAGAVPKEHGYELSFIVLGIGLAFAGVAAAFVPSRASRASQAGGPDEGHEFDTLAVDGAIGPAEAGLAIGEHVR
jgi:EmrB/QacA subfamily drug resistance transporter